MNRTVRARAALAATGVAVVGLAVGASLSTAAVAAPRPSTTRIPGSAPRTVQRHRATGAVSSHRTTTLQVWMKPRTSAAAAYATAVSTPGSSTFHHYLSPAAYTAHFGASAASTKAVASWLKSKGFTHVGIGAQRDYVRATGTVGQANSAFDVRINHYRVRDAEGKTESITANDRNVSLPSKLARTVIGVTGLDDVKPETFHSQHAVPSDPPAGRTRCSHYYGQHVATGLPSYHGSTSFPSVLCGYTGAELRQAYGMNSASTGVGQTIAYIEIGTPYRMEATLKKWASTNGLPAPKSTNYQELSLGRGNDCGNEFDIEEQLDIESGYAMAPDAHQLLVGGDSCEEQYQGVQPLFDADLTVVNGTGSAPYASMTSNSWGLTGGESTFPAVYVNVLHAILVKAAAEGVGMYFSSGDNPGVSVPADDPYATAVGGTSLGLGQTGQRLFETGWSNESLYLNNKGTGYIDGGIGRSAAGGGTSLLWKEPGYQKSVVPASMTKPGAGNVSGGLRAVPDISALADPYTGISQGVIVSTRKGDKYQVFPDGGTSLAAPLVSGMVAAAQQGQAKPFGFLNPVFYKLAGTSAINDTLPVTSSTPSSQQAVFCPENDENLCFGNSLETFDSETKANTDQVTAKGYDTMSGVGTPNGQSFIAALRTRG